MKSKLLQLSRFGRHWQHRLGYGVIRRPPGRRLLSDWGVWVADSEVSLNVGVL